MTYLETGQFDDCDKWVGGMRSEYGQPHNILPETGDYFKISLISTMPSVQLMLKLTILGFTILVDHMSQIP